MLPSARSICGARVDIPRLDVAQSESTEHWNTYHRNFIRRNRTKRKFAIQISSGIRESISAGGMLQRFEANQFDRGKLAESESLE